MQTKRHLFFPLMIICFGLILCVSLATFFFSLSKIKGVDSNANIFSESFNVYFLEIASSNVESEAVQLGKDSMINNDAGYVWEQGKYYVISSCYINENDAVLMKKKREQSNLYGDIIVENFPAISVASIYSNKEKEVLLTALNSFYNVYTNLYDVSISLDGKHLNETSALLKINETKSMVGTIKNNFETLFKVEKTGFLSLIHTHLVELSKSLDLLSEKNYVMPLQTFSSAVKYRYCEVLHNYKGLLEDINEEK